jgi:hypothetical protein
MDSLHVEVSSLKKVFAIEEKEILQDIECIREFAKVMSEIYVSNILCAKINQRIRKVSLFSGFSVYNIYIPSLLAEASTGRFCLSLTRIDPWKPLLAGKYIPYIHCNDFQMI